MSLLLLLRRIFGNAWAKRPEDYGAVGDGVTDDTAAIHAAIAAAGPGGLVYLSSTYRHHGIVHVDQPFLMLAGVGTLYASNPAAQGVWFEADGASANGVRFTSSATERLSTLENQHVVLLGSRNRLVDVTVDGSAAAGIFVFGATDFTIVRPIVRNTLADGIHMTDGAARGLVLNSLTEDTGDDAVAVVSYGEAVCADIVVQSPIVRRSNARGVVIGGGTNVRYYDADVTDTVSAGIYVASEESWNTASVAGAVVSGATLRRCNSSLTQEHGSICVYCQPDFTVEAVIEHVVITDPVSSVWWHARALGVGSTVTLSDIAVERDERALAVAALGATITQRNVRFV